jgi:hypothetical protein
MPEMAGCIPPEERKERQLNDPEFTKSLTRQSLYLLMR